MLLSELTALRAPSGWEDAARDALRREAEAILGGREGRVYGDTMGNLYALRKGTDGTLPHLMLAAHMDEVGFIVRFAGEDGLLRIDCVGGVDPRCAISKRVLVGEQAVPGVIGVKAIHLMSEEERKKAPDIGHIFIDIGAKDKDEAERLCPPGSYATFDGDYREFGDGLVKAKALDDRAGCAIALELLKNSYDCDFYAVFTVQEELGLRGAQAAVYNVAPDVALILEGTTANDMPEAEGHQHVTRVGGGPAISFMDGGTIVKPKMFEALKRTAREAGIPFQIRQGTRGGTDAGAIHKALSGCVAGGISVPCRYIHSPGSVASIRDFENAYKLADSFLKTKKFDEVL